MSEVEHTRAMRNSSVIVGLFIQVGFRLAASHGAQTVHDSICDRINCCIMRLAHRTWLGRHKIDRAAMKEGILEHFSASLNRPGDTATIDILGGVH